MEIITIQKNCCPFRRHLGWYMTLLLMTGTSYHQKAVEIGSMAVSQRVDHAAVVGKRVADSQEKCLGKATCLRKGDAGLRSQMTHNNEKHLIGQSKQHAAGFC